jgi:hypothetical protein
MEHVVFLDRSGYRNHYRDADGRPLLDPSRYRVTLMTLPEKAAEADPSEVDRVLVTDMLDERAILDRIPELKAGPEVHRVVTTGERFLVPAGAIRTALGVPGPSAEQMQIYRNKGVMKRHFGAHGIRTPEFREIETPMDAADLLDRHGAIVLKPLLSMGSVGFHKVSSRSELAALAGTGLSDPGPYEAEEFIDGDLYHVNSVVDAGRPVAVSVSRYIDSQSVYGLGGQSRSVEIRSGRVFEQMSAFNEQLLASTPWFSGATHLEVFVDRDGALILCEIAGRPGGGAIVAAFQHRFGVDLHWATMLPQLGRPIPEIREVQPPDRAVTGETTFFAPAVGTIRAYDGLPYYDWVVDYTPTKKIGDMAVAPKSVGQGVATVAICGPDTETVTARLDKLQHELSIVID